MAAKYNIVRFRATSVHWRMATAVAESAKTLTGLVTVDNATKQNCCYDTHVGCPYYIVFMGIVIDRLHAALGLCELRLPWEANCFKKVQRKTMPG
jgi:hypothetical protein